jgi:hypothetical protein
MAITTLRRATAVLCVLSIAGMIAFSVGDNVGGAMTAGIVGALAIGALMVGNAVHLGSNAGGAQDGLAEELEARVQELIASGADEATVRGIVRRAVRLGRGDRNAGAAS